MPAATATTAAAPNQPAWRQNHESFLTVAPITIISCFSLPSVYGGYLHTAGAGSAAVRGRVGGRAKQQRTHLAAWAASMYMGTDKSARRWENSSKPNFPWYAPVPEGPTPPKGRLGMMN